MAIFPDIDSLYRGKTQTNLVVSEGWAPAEKFIASSEESVKFQYAFGPEGNQNVVIPKGKIVQAATNGVEYDIETEKNLPAVKIAGEGSNALGVSLYNAYEKLLDKTSANNVTVLTRNYIRVPLFGNTNAGIAQNYAKAIQFGAAWVDTDQIGQLMGSYVVSDANGNFRAKTAQDSSEAIVGQVMAIETDVPPAGYLQYFMEMTDNEFTKLIQGTATNYASPGRPTSVSTDPLRNLDINTFPVGSYIKDRASLAKILKNFRSGIPFLTDGYFKARTTKTYVSAIKAADLVTAKTAIKASTATAIDADSAISDKAAAKTAANALIDAYSAAKTIRVMGGTMANGTEAVTVNEATGTVTVKDTIGAAMFIQIPEKLTLTKLDPLSTDVLGNHPELGGVADSLVVKVGGKNVPANRLHVDYDNMIIGIYFNEKVTDAEVTITATVLENQIPGVPSGWDYKGNIGEARILLRK